MTLETPRLILRPFAAEDLLALIESRWAFEDRTGLRAADGLREFMVSADVSPAWLAQLRATSGIDPWTLGYAVIERETGAAVGSASFKGQASPTGVVEIAYGIVPSRENRGYATEVATALVLFAWQDSRVQLVRAHTLPQSNASSRVLTKCGFARIGEVIDPEDGQVWRWETPRRTTTS